MSKLTPYEASQKFQLTALTDQEQADILKKLTVKPVQISELRIQLRELGLLIKGTSGWKGPLVAAGGDSIDYLTDALEDPHQETIATDQLSWSGMFYDTIIALVAGQLLTAEQGDKVFNLGGGLAYPGLTAQDIAASRQKAEHQAAVDSALSDVATYANLINKRATAAAAEDDATVQSVYDAAKAVDVPAELK